VNGRLITVAAATAGITLVVGVAVAIVLPVDPEPLAPDPTTTVIPIPADRPHQVVRVVDGDTVVVRIGQTATTIRLLGLDTPETKHPTKPVQCYGPQATAYAKDELPVGEHVALVYGSRRTDRYGRTLGYVVDQDGDYGLRALRGGYARIYPGNHPQRDTYVAAEAAARRAGAGLWGACATTEEGT
jgi:micrococcal nuclease